MESLFYILAVIWLLIDLIKKMKGAFKKTL